MVGVRSLSLLALAGSASAAYLTVASSRTRADFRSTRFAATMSAASGAYGFSARYLDSDEIAPLSEYQVRRTQAAARAFTARAREQYTLLV